MFGSLINAIGLGAAQNATQAQSQSAQASQAYQNMNALNAYSPYYGAGTQAGGNVAGYPFMCPPPSPPNPNEARFAALAKQLLDRRYSGLCSDLGSKAYTEAIALYHQRIRKRADEFPTFMSALEKAYDEPSDDNTSMLMVMARLVGLVDPDEGETRQ